jgi:hypothetical protein
MPSFIGWPELIALLMTLVFGFVFIAAAVAVGTRLGRRRSR